MGVEKEKYGANNRPQIGSTVIFPVSKLHFNLFYFNLFYFILINFNLFSFTLVYLCLTRKQMIDNL